MASATFSRRATQPLHISKLRLRAYRNFTMAFILRFTDYGHPERLFFKNPKLLGWADELG